MYEALSYLRARGIAPWDDDGEEEDDADT